MLSNMANQIYTLSEIHLLSEKNREIEIYQDYLHFVQKRYIYRNTLSHGIAN